MKICSRCGLEQPLDQFCKNKKSRDGKDSACRSCKRIYQAEYVRRPDAIERIKLNKRNYSRDPRTRAKDRSYRATQEVKDRRRANDKKSPRHIFYATLGLALKRRPSSRPITVQQLMNLWLAQENKCAISGLDMTWAQRRGPSPTSVSMDRIDPDKGYELGNIRLICHAFNALRGRMSDAEMLAMAKALVANMEAGDRPAPSFPPDSAFMVMQ